MTTTNETFRRQYGLALQALGLHIEEHDLPVPVAIDTIEDHHFGHRPATYRIKLRLPVFPDQQAAWLDSVCIDDETNELVEMGIRATWSVRLPDTGFRFDLVGLRVAAVSA